METDVSGYRSTPVVLKTIRRVPRTFINQIYAVDVAVTAWVSLGSLSYSACAFFLEVEHAERSCKASIGEQVASMEWTFQVQTAAFGAVLLLNLLNLGMRQHLLPFKCNLLLLYINAVAFATDLLLWRGSTTVLVSSSGRPFAPLRYLQWAHSTPSMIYMLALLADCNGMQLAIPLLSDVVMVLSGLAACYTRGPTKDLMTIVSFVTFAVVLYFVYGMFHKTLCGDVSPEQRGTLRTVLALLLALWSAFPVVWLAADWHLIDAQSEAICWGVCDYLAKVVFSSQLWQSNLTEVQLRRDRALEAWEASNRVEAVTRLTALLKQRDDLLSTLSHELRTPLAGIVALSETLYQEVSAALPKSALNLATVRATATCMLNIVTSTLDSFAARRGGPGPSGAGAGAGSEASHVAGDDGPVALSVPLAAFDLRPLVETVTTVLRPLAHDGVAIVSDLPANLPQVVADATRLSQVLYNLVGNAMRFTSHGEVRVAARVVLPEGSDAAPAVASIRCGDCTAEPVTAAANNIPSNTSTGGGGIWRYTRPRLSLSSASSCSSSIVAFPPGSQVEVSVEDTGVGIAQELLDELFLPYRTGQAAQGDENSTYSDGSGANKASRSIGGTGLGLYLVRLALRAQGSDITAESAPGIGSVFRFRLPLAPHQHQHYQHAAGAAQRKRGASLEMHHLQNQQQHQQADDEVVSQAPLSGDCAEARSSCNSSAATTASDASAGERAVPVVPSSPKPTVPSSPKPWIASATSRLMKLSATAGGAAAASAMASTGVGPRPSTGVQPLHETSSLVGGRPLRMSLDEQHRSLRLPPSASPGAAPAATRCGVSCSAGCCAPEPTPAAWACSSTCENGEVVAIAADGLPQTAAAAEACAAGSAGAASCGPAAVSAAAARGTAVGGVGMPLGRLAIPAALTPTPTPTAAATRLSAGSVPSLTAFDVAHAIEEGRALSSAGLRPSYRQRNNGVLQVLSVDDDPINQLVAGQMLTSQSWKVVKCMNGPEALAHLQLIPRPGTAAAAAAATPEAAASLAAAAAAAAPSLLPTVLPDCVLLDVMMPGMSGFEVCRKLREHFSSAQLPIIIVSAKGDSAAVDEAFDSGADDYMTKPYKRAEMVARIKAQIRIRDSILGAVTAAAAAVPATPLMGTTGTVGAAPVPSIANGPSIEVVVPMPAALPAGVPTSATPTAASTPRAACLPAIAARSLLGGGAASDVVAPSPSLSPLHPLLQSLADARPTSVDVLLLQQQNTPDSIKIRMDANRSGLDGSWGKVALYKRESLLSRTAGAVAPADATAAAQAPPLKDAVTAPAAVLGSATTESGQLIDIGSSAAAAARSMVSAVMSGTGTGSGMAAGVGPVVQLCSGDSTEVLNRRLLAPPPMADAAVGSSRPVPTLSGGTEVVPAVEPVNVATDACQVASRVASSLPPPEPPPASEPCTAIAVAGTTGDEPVTAAAAGRGVAGSGDEGAGAGREVTALMQEVLSEVRRSRAVEAEMEKLNARVATLRTACCTMAAERDGWRRQARDLRALLATGLGGAAAAAALAAGTPPGSGASKTALIGNGVGTPSAQWMLPDALAAAHGSRSSGDSLGVGLGTGGVAIVAGHAGGAGTGNGMSGSMVAAQLEDLKKEAASLRQQLSLAMASVGNGSVAMGRTDGGGSRTFGSANGVQPLRQQRSGLSLGMSPAADSPQSSGVPAGGGTATGAGDTERSGGGAGDAAQQWGVSVFPNPAYAGAPPDLFLTTETSGLSAAISFVARVSADGRGKAGAASAVAASRSPPSLGGLSASETHPSGKVQKRALAHAVSSSLLDASSAPSASIPAATAAGAGAGAGPGVIRPSAAVPDGPAPNKQVNGVAAVTAVTAGTPTPPGACGAAANGGAGVPHGQVANGAAAGPTPQDVSYSQAGRAEPPQVFGELRGSSAASTGGRRSSVEEEHSSAGRSPVLPGTTRGSRNRGGSGGPAATTGILRMLCSKGAAAPASPPRRNPHQQ